MDPTKYLDILAGSGVTGAVLVLSIIANVWLARALFQQQEKRVAEARESVIAHMTTAAALSGVMKSIAERTALMLEEARDHVEEQRQWDTRISSIERSQADLLREAQRSRP